MCKTSHSWSLYSPSQFNIDKTSFKLPWYCRKEFGVLREPCCRCSWPSWHLIMEISKAFHLSQNSVFPLHPPLQGSLAHNSVAPWKWWDGNVTSCSISPNQHEEWGADGKYTAIVAENKVTLIKVLCKWFQCLIPAICLRKAGKSPELSACSRNMGIEVTHSQGHSNGNEALLWLEIIPWKSPLCRMH